jgi:hypothetical protein
MTETFTLEIHCPKCGGALEAQYVDWNEGKGESVETGYTCPYCQTEVETQAAGRIAWVVKADVAGRQQPQ